MWPTAFTIVTPNTFLPRTEKKIPGWDFRCERSVSLTSCLVSFEHLNNARKMVETLQMVILKNKKRCQRTKNKKMRSMKVLERLQEQVEAVNILLKYGVQRTPKQVSNYSKICERANHDEEDTEVFCGTDGKNVVDRDEFHADTFHSNRQGSKSTENRTDDQSEFVLESRKILEEV